MAFQREKNGTHGVRFFTLTKYIPVYAIQPISSNNPPQSNIRNKFHRMVKFSSYCRIILCFSFCVNETASFTSSPQHGVTAERGRHFAVVPGNNIDSHEFVESATFEKENRNLRFSGVGR